MVPELTIKLSIVPVVAIKFAANKLVFVAFVLVELVERRFVIAPFRAFKLRAKTFVPEAVLNPSQEDVVFVPAAFIQVKLVPLAFPKEIVWIVEDDRAAVPAKIVALLVLRFKAVSVVP